MLSAAVPRLCMVILICAWFCLMWETVQTDTWSIEDRGLFRVALQIHDNRFCL